MDLTQKASRLGYKHYTEFTVEELDKLPLGNSNKQIEYYFIQKWLRDIHNIDVEAPLVYRLNTRKYRVKIYRHNTEIILSTFHFYNTYEEALEEGLFQALLLI